MHQSSAVHWQLVIMAQHGITMHSIIQPVMCTGKLKTHTHSETMFKNKNQISLLLLYPEV